jgi:UDP-glucose 4-epimerase
MGSHVVDAVLAASDIDVERVVVVDDMTGGTSDNVPTDPRVEFITGDVTDHEFIDQLFNQHRFQYVYHLAAYAAEGLSHFIRRFNYTNNLLGSVNLINAAVKYETSCFVFTSSIAVYGDQSSPLRETDAPHPVDPYGIAKYAVELDLAAAHELFGLDYVVLRPHNVYGERQNLSDRYRNVIGIFMNHILNGRALPVYGDGTQERAFTYIGDVAPVIARAPTVEAARNEVFNLGSDAAMSVGELAKLIAAEFGVSVEIEHLPMRHEVHVAYSDHTKARLLLDATQDTPLKTGLHRMAEWAKTAVLRPSQKFDPIEIEKNLPPSWRD